MTGERTNPAPDVAETETFTEWRLTGQPSGPFPFYDVTVREDHNSLAGLMLIWSKIRSGEYPWTDAQLRSREVTITRTPWEDVR